MPNLLRAALAAGLALAVGCACGRAAAPAAATPAAAAPTALAGCTIFPPDNAWNTRVDTLPVAAHSAEYVAGIGAELPLHADFGSSKYGDFGIPINIVAQGAAKLPVSFEYADESDPGPYPIPDSPKIEAGGDRHILIVEQGACVLYEIYAAELTTGGWQAGSGAIFDLGSHALRSDGWTSADAAGLPILPGLARYDEVAAGAIRHALRVTAPCTADAYIWPARHKAVPDDCPGTAPAGARFPPMGLRLRLKASFDISGFSHDTQVLLLAMQRYGLLVADNGSAWYVSGAPDEGWADDTLVDELKQVHGSDFEVVDTSSLMIHPDSGQARQVNASLPKAAYLPLARR